jgi:Tfp pilus assembly protein PilX
MRNLIRRLRDERGFTMLIAIGVMFVTSLLLVAAFTAANGDVHTSRLTVDQKKAYYAALAGIQEYEYQLQYNPNYWQSCPAPHGEVTGEPSKAAKEESEGSYEVTTLAAKTDPEASKTCNTASPFSTIIESSGSLANTFRIKSVGKSGKSSRSVVATFQVAGFLQFVYFTQFEDQDPEAYGGNTECGAYEPEREAKGIKCNNIYFGQEDEVRGPMHTNDSTNVCGGAEFGRAGHEPPDSIEVNRGANVRSCGSGPVVYNTASKEPSVGQDLEAPPSDGSLKFYVEHTPQNNEFEGRTKLKLEGATNKIKVTKYNGAEETIEWPKNGLIYVNNRGSGCGYTNFEQEGTDNATTYKEEENCGSAYVEGSYSKSLTIAASTDLIITGSITENGVTAGNPPTGTAALGLIATRFVRMYHPCSGGNNTTGPVGSTPLSPWIYGAILSTSHSFLVDNYECGANLGKLNMYGAIGQKFRGIVGKLSGEGYYKNYLYDERLATDEPPYFLAPLKAGWRIIRETAPTAG